MPDYEAVRDYLYSKMRGADEPVTTDTSTDDPELALLESIRDEIRATTKVLGGEAS